MSAWKGHSFFYTPLSHNCFNSLLYFNSLSSLGSLLLHSKAPSAAEHYSPYFIFHLQSYSLSLSTPQKH
ncbi:hypothetical protein M6B38_335025 [Iris pallida]|uniref:Uncharacterized protein n=1 Tax=Iris pallida TaxID=29817 RepID=A0AAX6H0T9_IRIPA|nr:hypothetical protein M6B38_335025 [Iris pallida]